jgi:TetR/AcrR family transcriptional regulator, regulator of cefoperazone and chloramphenicol sensitivity
VSEDSTRARVIDAAVACILEEGFYRASSNQIARRAGVTWGVIQYHFGTREALLLAVHERGLEELARCLSDAVIKGETVEARLGSFVDALWAYYRRPEFLAYMQVMLNLSHDPTTAESTRDAMQSVQYHVEERMRSLVREVLGEECTDEQVEETGRFVYNVVRGLALDQELIEAGPLDPRSSASDFDAQRARLVRALARSLDGNR